jgi:acyl-CoA thioesterase
VTSDAAADFERAIALEPIGEGRLAATIQPGWDIRGNPHGGYLLALVAAAAGTVTAQDDPISVSATYLAPPEFGPADLTVEVARAGRRQSTVSVAVRQYGLERVRAVVTTGTLDDVTPETLAEDTTMPGGPGPEECIRVQMPSGEEPIALHQHVDLRLHPDTGFVKDEPTGRPELNGWLRLADGSGPDPFLLLMFSDGAPPTMLEALGRAVGHVPTIQLTTHLFARPSPGWVRCRFRTRVRAGSLVDEDGELWDADGRLVATARQLALLR